MVNSLLGNHDSESIEISQRFLGFPVSELLGPCGLLPSLENSGLSESLLEDLGGSTTSDRNVEVSQRQPTDRDLLSLNT